MKILSILEDILSSIKDFSEVITENKERILKEFPLSRIVILYEEIYLKGM